MEKKQYMQPALTVVKVFSCTLLEGSNPDYTPTESFSDEGAVGSRRRTFGVWDDEEE